MVAIVIAVLLGGDLIIVAVKWPFTRAGTVEALGRVTECKVEIGHFHRSFFPQPGYTADTVVFKRASGAPLATVQRIVCHASWLGLLTFTHRVREMRLNGVRVEIPDHVPGPVQHQPISIPTTVTDLDAPGAVLEIHHHRLDFPHLHLSNLAKNKSIRFDVTLFQPELVGQAHFSGSVGPFDLHNVGNTHLSGQFRLDRLDLQRFQAVSGSVSAEGRFGGSLGAADITGRLKIPQFSVTHSGNCEGLTAEYEAVVNGTQGNVTLKSAAVHFLASTLRARGSVIGDAKTTELDIAGDGIHAQDLLHMFVHGYSPITGSLSMNAHVRIPPGRDSFLDRVQLDGNFSIDDGIFTRRETEEKIDQLSMRASGRKHDPISSDVACRLASQLRLRHEVATLTDARFVVPGAIARGSGTYNLRNHAIDLQGIVAMRAMLSQAATGFKSIISLPLDPFFKKGGAGAVLPVRMTGTYDHPVFKVKL